MSSIKKDLMEQALAGAAKKVSKKPDNRIIVPTTDDELHQAMIDNFNINIPRVKVCEHHVAPFTAFANAFFARDPIAIWWASRGFGGKTLLLSSLSLAESAFLGALVNLLGGSGEQSSRVLAYMNGTEMPGALWFAKNAPGWLVEGGVPGGLLKQTTSLTNGGVIKALMASSKSVRGPHPQRLRVDEADEMELKLFDDAMGQPMAKGGIQDQVVASSTYHYANGTMTALLKRAAERGWPVYQWCYRENLVSNGGWLLDAQVDRKKTVITTAMWDTEYENQEPNPEGRAIDMAKCKAAFQPSFGVYEGAEYEDIIIEEPYKGGEQDPVCKLCKWAYDIDDDRDFCPSCNLPRGLTSPGRYSTATDWAKKKDWTITITNRIDVNPIRLVAFRRTGRLPWPVLVAQHEDRVKRYGGQATHDATGVGDVIHDYMTTASEGVIMMGQERYETLQNYIMAIEKGLYVAPMIRFMYNEHYYCSWEDVFRTGENFHCPDTIMAGALSLRGVIIGDGGEILIPGVNILTNRDTE